MKKILDRYRGWPRRQKIGFWLATLVLCYALTGFLVAPPILKAVLKNKLPELLQRSVAIETIRLNPFALSATVEGFKLADQEGGTFVAFERFYVNLELLSVFKQALIVQSLTLEKPTIDFSRIDAATFSFSDLLVAPEPTEPAPAAAEPALFSINNIEIKDGTVRFHDLPRQIDHEVADLQLAIPSISNLPTRVEITVQPQFAAVINGTPLDLGGGSKPFAESKATEVNVKMTGIDLSTYLAYIPNPTGLILKSALLDLDTRVAYRLYPNQVSRLAVTGTVVLRQLDIVDDQGQSYLRLPSMALVLSDSNLLNREIRLSELTISSPQLELQRRKNGELLPLVLLSPPAGQAETSPAVGDAAEVVGPPLRLTIERLRLNQGEVSFADQALETPASLRLQGITLAVDNLSTVPGTASTLSLTLQLNQAGRFSTQGSLVFDPLALKTSLSLDALQLKDFQAYLAEQARVVLASGSLTIKGDLSVSQPEGEAAVFSFAGASSIDDLATADKLSGADLLKWQALEFKGIRFDSQPTALSLDEILLKGAYVQVLINDDGTANLASLAKQQPESAAVKTATPETAAASKPAAAPAERPVITIGKVVLSNGKLEFQDRNIQPSYGLKLDQLQGSISGLSSDLEKRATVALSARVDQQAPLAISGTTNPLSVEPFADIKIAFKGFNLPPLSPYTGKYIGNKTGKGKLSLDLGYKIEGHKLESSNKVLLDQFTLGQPVESPDATGLPVSLAIALLKDRSGEINLDIPVAGDLDDPEFSVAGVVVQVIVNLIAKAATSPFALLGALIPEGEDIQHIPFDPGTAVANATTLDKLEVVANVLHERPGLKMEIAGHIDRSLDSAALAKSMLQQLVKLEKIKSTGVKPGKDGKTPEVAVSAEEYPGYLKNAYRLALKQATREQREAAAKLKPANAVEEQAQMEAFLLGNIQVADEELRLLAIERANTVLSQLVDVGKVEPDRLFVVEPELPAVEVEAATDPQTLVELSIK
jgi:uncharacterized protein involved in outer membrane biogenesis